MSTVKFTGQHFEVAEIIRVSVQRLLDLNGGFDGYPKWRDCSLTVKDGGMQPHVGTRLVNFRGSLWFDKLSGPCILIKCRGVNRAEGLTGVAPAGQFIWGHSFINVEAWIDGDRDSKKFATYLLKRDGQFSREWHPCR
jgi:hypothetical protein